MKRIDLFAQKLVSKAAKQVAISIIHSLTKELQKEYNITSEELREAMINPEEDSVVKNPDDSRIVEKQNVCKKYEVFIQTVGANLLQIVKDVKEFLGLGLKEAKFLVDEARDKCKCGNGYKIITFDSIENATAFKKLLEHDGAKVNIIEVKES